MRPGWRLTQPPRALSRVGITLDNLAVVPARLLPHGGQWQQIANSLPAGGVLIKLRSPDKPQRNTLQSLSALLEAKRHQVITVPAGRSRSI